MIRHRHFTLTSILALLLILTTLLGACKEKGDEPHTPALLESVSDIDEEYRLSQNELLVITPKIELKEGEISEVRFEWGMGGKVVGTEPTLRVKCEELGLFDAYLKVTTDNSGIIKEFKVRVSSANYDKGLLLLSEADGRSLLSFKRLDRMDSGVALDVFGDNNPHASLGAKPLSLCWTGEGITNPNNIDDSGGLFIVLGTTNPLKSYLIDSRTMKINSEITHDGDFTPEHVTAPFGGQNRSWGRENIVCFISGGKTFPYQIEGEKRFVKPYRSQQIPDEVSLAPLTCNLITTPTDVQIAGYDLISKRMVYIGGLSGTLIGTHSCGVEQPMNILACNGIYADTNADRRYEPREVILVGSVGNDVKILRFTPPVRIRKKVNPIDQREVLVREIPAGTHIEPTAATGVSPTRPFFYYGSSRGDIFLLNYDNAGFSDKPFISLGEKFAVRSLIFNPYDANTLYIAAEDRTEKSDRIASLFIYDVRDNAHPKRLYEAHKVGGKVKKLVYKGNGLEHLTKR